MIKKIALVGLFAGLSMISLRRGGAPAPAHPGSPPSPEIAVPGAPGAPGAPVMRGGPCLPGIPRC